MKRGRKGTTRRRKALVAVAASVLVVFVVADVVSDEPIRRWMERGVGARLRGYSFHLGGLDFHLAGFSIDFEQIVLVQDRHPEPPVARIPRFGISVQWMSLFRGALVADLEVDGPRIHLTRTQSEAEARDEVPVEKRGWQDALEAMYPFRINEFVVRDGELTYDDENPFPPLHLREVHAHVENIRNVHSAERVYPSLVDARGLVFDRGFVSIHGRADFLARPRPGIAADVELRAIDLSRFRPIVERANLILDRGTLSAKGTVDVSPRATSVLLANAEIAGLKADYVDRPGPAPEGDAVEVAVETAKEVADEPDVRIRADRCTLDEAEIGYVNASSDPPYRLFVSDATAEIENASSRFVEGPARATLRGRFMGHGESSADVSFRSEKDGPDFELQVRIAETPLPDLNELLRAHAGLDVAAGWFSFYSEIAVRDRRISGYYKPLFRDVRIYEFAQDLGKNVVSQAYEAAVSGLAEIFTNRPRDQVATEIEVSGRVDSPRTDTLGVMYGLVENAFVSAIVPGLRGEVERPPD